MTTNQMIQANSLLGYPADARLLIINADDFGMCHAINAAVLLGYREGVVSSTSLMVPCPWAPHAIRMLKENPDIPFGVHLTVTSNPDHYRWGPLTAKSDVPSLVDEQGCFFSDERIPMLLAQARLDELEAEYRTQIQAVEAAGLEPSHLDWHCLPDGGRSDIFEMAFGLATEYGLAMRIHGRELAERLTTKGLPATDYDLLDSFRLDIDGKTKAVIDLLHHLPAGLSEWAVHPSLGNAEAQAMEPDNWKVRRTDLDFLLDSEVREVLEAEKIVLIDYRDLQTRWVQVA